tara:strand:- start:117 stop:875 length:759 start_codon:yes stop_codon:yes gene_type:complete
MTWYDANYKQRQPVAIDALTGDGSQQNKDVQLTIPKTWDIFWDNIQSNLYDVVPVSNDGTLLTFERTTENHATRTLVITLDNHSVKTQAINFIYLYFQNPDQSSDPATPFTPSSPINAYIDISQAGGFIVRQPLNRPATAEPLQAIVKASTDIIDVYFAISGLFRSMLSPYAQRVDFEGVNYVNIYSLNSSGTNDTGRYEEADTRFISGFVRARAKGGSDSTDYALVCRVVTSTEQQIDIRCLVQVRDQLPT